MEIYPILEEEFTTSRINGCIQVEIKNLPELISFLSIYNENYSDEDYLTLYRGQKKHYNYFLPPTYLRPLKNVPFSRFKTYKMNLNQFLIKIFGTRFFDFDYPPNLLAFRENYDQIAETMIDVYQGVISLMATLDFSKEGTWINYDHYFDTERDRLKSKLEPILQHYGLRTKWLDFSDKFSVALKFATKTHTGVDQITNNYEERCGYIFIANYQKKDLTLKDDFYELSNSPVGLVDLTKVTPDYAARPRIQGSYLMTNSHYDDFEYWKKLSNKENETELFNIMKDKANLINQVSIILKIEKNLIIKYLTKINELRTNLFPSPKEDPFFKISWINISHTYQMVSKKKDRAQLMRLFEYPENILYGIQKSEFTRFQDDLLTEYRAKILNNLKEVNSSSMQILSHIQPLKIQNLIYAFTIKNINDILNEKFSCQELSNEIITQLLPDYFENSEKIALVEEMIQLTALTMINSSKVILYYLERLLKMKTNLSRHLQSYIQGKLTELECLPEYKEIEESLSELNGTLEDDQFEESDDPFEQRLNEIIEKIKSSDKIKRNTLEKN